MMDQKVYSMIRKDYVKEAKGIDEEENLRQIYWGWIRSVRQIVQKSIELYRKDKIITDSLDAKVHIFCDEPLYSSLDILKNEADYIFGVSEFVVQRLTPNILMSAFPYTENAKFKLGDLIHTYLEDDKNRLEIVIAICSLAPVVV